MKKWSDMRPKAEVYMRVLTLISRFAAVFALMSLSTMAIAQTKVEEATPHFRVVSTSLCGDGYVLSLLPHTKITALSWQSNDALSNAPEDMRTQPKAWDNVERLLALNPSLVVFGAGEGAVAKPLLDKAGIQHASLTWGEDFKSITTNTHNLRKAFGLLDEPTLHAPLPLKNSTVAKPKILYLSSAGGTAGTGTYVDAALRQAGGENIITQFGWHSPDPETLVALKPDLIITSFFKDAYDSVNQVGLRNKVLQSKLDTTPHVNIPGKLWPCAGPDMYKATALIEEAIKALNQ